MIELTLAWGNEKVYVNPAHVEYVHQELRLPSGGNTEVMTTIVSMQSGMAFLVQGDLADVVMTISGNGVSRAWSN